MEPAARRTRTARRRRASLAIVAVPVLAALALLRPWQPAPRSSLTPLSQPAHLQVVASPLGIATRDLAAEHERRLVRGPVFAAALAPDGRAVAYLAATPTCRLGVADLTTGAVLEVAACGGMPRDAGLATSILGTFGDGHRYALAPFDAVSWSPDGRRLAYPCPNAAHACVVAREGGRPVDVGEGFSPSFAPDGSAIALLRDPPARPGASYPYQLQLWVVRHDGRDARELGRLRQRCCLGTEVAAGWSEDSSRILVAGTRVEAVDVGTGSVIELSSRGGVVPAQQAQLVQPLAGGASPIVWPDAVGASRR